MLQALIFYLMEKAPPEEQNFSTLAEMLEFARLDGMDEENKTDLDRLFDIMEEEEPDHIALKQYKIFKQSGDKTAMSILVSTAVRLTPFNLKEIKRITSGQDEMELESYGEEKTVLFAVIPDNHTSLNFLVSMLFAQLMDALYRQADQVYKGPLPVHVRFMWDEYPSIKAPEDFDKFLSTMRSRNVSSTIFVQAMSQLKVLHEKAWEVICGNCDCLIYLGGNENFTHEYLSKALGKETIDTTTRGVTKGKSGSSNQNFQNAGRELLQLNEVRMLPNDESIILIRGELPIMDKKIDLMKHPNIKHLSDGGAPVYQDHLPKQATFLSMEEAFDLDHIEQYSFFEDEEESKAVTPH